VFLVIGLMLGTLLKRKSKIFIFFLIVIDLFIFSFYGTGFRGNIAPFSYLTPSHQKLFQSIKKDSDTFRVLPFGVASRKLPNWCTPNANMIYGIDSVALYTPLAPKRYRDALDYFEVVDDSLGVREPKEEAFLKQQEALRLLNVKYILSDRKLDFDNLVYIAEEDGVYLYQYKNFLPRVFFTHSLNAGLIQAEAKITINESGNGVLKLSVVSGEDGFVVFSQMPYPGWTASLNQKQAVILDVSHLAQAVEVKKGASQIAFRFRPRYALK
jgi:hypothetical protein